MPREKTFRSGVVEHCFEFLDVEFSHLPHLGHYSFFLRLALGGVPLVEIDWRDLPVNAILVDQPTALDGPASAAGQLLPVSVDLALGFAGHDERNGLVESHLGVAVQQHNFLPQESEVHGQYRALFDAHGVAAPIRSFADLRALEDLLVEFSHCCGFIVRPDAGVDFEHGAVLLF